MSYWFCLTSFLAIRPPAIRSVFIFALKFFIEYTERLSIYFNIHILMKRPISLYKNFSSILKIDFICRMLPTNMLNISFGRKLRKNISNSMGEQDSFGYSNTPNVLRREDGHHSAFASYRYRKRISRVKKVAPWFKLPMFSNI